MTKKYDHLIIFGFIVVMLLLPIGMIWFQLHGWKAFVFVMSWAVGLCIYIVTGKQFLTYDEPMNREVKE